MGRWCVSVCVSTRGRNLLPTVRLHPPSLACEFSASYGEMSRRSGDLSAEARSAEEEAEEEDNHSDISPSLESTVCKRSST